MSWFDSSANRSQANPKNTPEAFDLSLHPPSKARNPFGFVPFNSTGERSSLLMDFRVAHFHVSDDDDDLHSNYKDDSVQPIRRLGPMEPVAGDHSRSVNPSLRFNNTDLIGFKDEHGCAFFDDNDPGSICYLESDNDFVPDYEPANNTLNFVFNPSQDERVLTDDNLLRKIQQLTARKGKERPGFHRGGDGQRIEFFQITRPSRKASIRPSVFELQEKIEMMNQSRERSRQMSEAVDEGETRPKPDATFSISFLPREAGPILATDKSQVTPPNTPTNSGAVGTAVAELQPNPEGLSCRCKKTNCLKLYCECFLKGGMCGPQCKCVGCMNTPAHQTIREMLLEDHYNKGAIAYNPKQQAVDDNVATVIKRDRRCTCGKTGCNKKYCECYRNGSKCSAECKCRGCKNGNEGRADEEAAKAGVRKQIKKRRSNFLNNLIEKMKICSLANNGSGANRRKEQ